MADAFVCPMCWFSFSTQEELNQHEEMEAAVDWPLDRLDDQPDPSTYADMK